MRCPGFYALCVVRDMDIIHDFNLKSIKKYLSFTLDKKFLTWYSIDIKRAGAQDICKELRMPEDWLEWYDQIMEMTDEAIEEMADYYARVLLNGGQNESN